MSDFNTDDDSFEPLTHAESEIVRLHERCARLRARNAQLVVALTFIKTGPLSSMLSAASEAPIGSDAMVAVPIDLIRHWDEVVSKALAGSE